MRKTCGRTDGERERERERDRTREGYRNRIFLVKALKFVRFS